MVAIARGAIGRALELIDAALTFSPGRPEYLAQAARCLALLHRDAEALARVDLALTGPLDDARVLDTLGVVCTRAGEHERAAALFSRAHAIDGTDAGIVFNLGAALRFLGRFDESEAAFERALALDPQCHGAHPAIASLRRQTAGRNHVARLEAALAMIGDDVDGELQIRHALAKELEDLGRYTEAFDHLESGKARKRRTLDYDFAADRALFEAVRAASPTRGSAAARPGEPSVEPIFVVGMPRSGTTLVERILSSHPQVSSAGELQNFGISLKRLAATASARVLDAATLAAAATVDPAALGRAYLDSTRPLTGRLPRFVDKLPLNFFYLGIIRQALPNARIVCLRRGALDTCLSNFRQLFAVNFSYYNYAYDLAATARYLVEFNRLMDHWQATLGDALLQVQYEALVAEPADGIGRLLRHCGLPWSSDCLDFDRNAAPVATASATQVREPLHARSVGRWRHYEDRLEPAIGILTAAGVPLEH